MITCPSCSTELPEGSRFCLSCGSALAPAGAVQEERKTVTTLFCDLVGFTAMSEAADPEDVEAVLGAYHERARREIEHHGGVVEKFIGDAVVGVFGVPAAHEDDPERSVRAGLRIVEALQGMKRPDGAPLQARVGVNTGETLVRLDVDPASGRGFLTGDAVNTAARLQASAPPMGVVAGGLTRELSAEAVVYEALPPVQAKGKSEPVPAWLAVRARSRTGLRTAREVRTPLMGRSSELGELRAAFADVRARGRADARLVVGEPGIGKSRLVLELARELEASSDLVVWRQGRCVPYGEGVTFWPLAELVKDHAGILDSDDVATVEAKLERALPEADDRAWLRQRLRALLGLEAPQAAREENFAAWTRFVESLASSHPAVIVIEDAHWAGEAMLDFLEHLLAQELAVPLLVVITARPELLARHDGRLTAEGEAGRGRLTLHALSAKDSSALVGALLSADPGAGDAERIAELAGGNPLFAEQYVRLLLEGGHLVPSGVGPCGPSGLQRPLPDTVHAVLAARLDTLPADQKAALCGAAVLGETFWCGAVAAVCDLDAAATRAALAGLVARELVRPAATSTLDGETEYLFWHALARDVAYGRLPRKARARQHRAAGRWLEEQTGERSGEFSEILAYHYERGLEYAVAAGDEDLVVTLRPAALRAFVLAGERALRLDVAAAERSCARGLELAAPDAPERPRLLQYWAQALWLRRRYHDAAVAYREAIEGYRAQGEIRAAAVAMCHLVSVLTWLGEPCFDTTRAAVDLLADDGPSAEKAEVLGLYALGLCLVDAGPQAVIEAADAAEEVAAVLGAPEPAMALSCRGSALLQLGDAGGFEDYERAIRAARDQGLGVERSTIELNFADLAFVRGGAQARLDVLRDGMEFTRAHGLESYVLSFQEAMAAARMSAGEWEWALAELGRLRAECDGSGELWDAVILGALHAVLLTLRGAADEALQFLPWVLDRGRESEIGWTRGYASLAGALVSLAMDRRDEGLDLLAQAFASSRAAALDPDDLPQAVRSALAAHGGALARRLVADIRACLPPALLPLQEHVMTTVDALLAEDDGDLEAAAAGFADAARRWRDFGVPYEEGHAHFGLGRCLVALGRAPEAAAPLALARDIFARLGAKPALAETEEWLAEAGS